MAPTQAADNGGIQDLLGGLADAASRRYAERYRDDARWDGKYYYDRYDNRRYTRSEWQREIQRRARAEDEGRDWRDSKRRAWEEKKYGTLKKQTRNRSNDCGFVIERNRRITSCSPSCSRCSQRP